MKLYFSRSLFIIPIVIFSLTACGYQEGGNGNQSSVHEIGDNRQEYIIKNRTTENEYLDMNTDPHMDTRASDEQLWTKSNAAIRLAENDMEQIIKRRVQLIGGVQSANVQVKDKKITIRFQPVTGANTQELKQHVEDMITKLYGLQVEVTAVNP